MVVNVFKGNLKEIFEVKYCSGTLIFSPKDKLLFSLTVSYHFNISYIINGTEISLLKVAGQQKTTILGKKKTHDMSVNRKIREPEGFSDLLQCVLLSKSPQGLIQSPL